MVFNYLPTTSAKFTKRNNPVSAAEGTRILASAKNAIIFLFLLLATLMPASLLAQENASAHDADAVAQRETHVTPAQALNVGYTFMRTGSGTRGGGTRGSDVRKQAMQLVYTDQAYDSLTGAVTDCYYVFALQPKGFVIVAADDRVEPILGYSYDNDFAVANMPDHVRAWLGSYERQIEAVTKSDLRPTPATESKWTDLRSGQSTSTRSGGTVGPLLTTTWDQGQYYNNLCPADANGPAGHAYTGCVATAMAQIIHYWGYPMHGRGAHSYYGNYGELTVNYANANYDYSLMPDALTSTSTTQEVDAVASLMRDCGVAVNMGYSPTESSSFDQDARAALINFYRYSPNLSFAEKAYFSDSEWNAMLHANLDNSRPVFYSGQGSGGHAFVCDGYDSDGYYHFNFGWGGFADGWFLTSSITPGGSNFNDSQAAIFGIVPDSTGNVILGQTQGTSTFTVDEPLEFYHLMGHNAYEGGNYDNGCNNTIHFIPADTTNQIVADILDFEDQTLTFSDGDGNPLRSLVGGSDNDYSPVVSSHNALNIAYSGNMYYAGFKLNISQTDNNGCRMVSNITTFVDTTTVHLTWTENGNATQWQIEYGIKGFALGTGTVYTATSNTVSFSNLQELTEYEFYIRSTCGSSHYGQWNKTTVLIEGRYWQDIVTSQPAGYVIDTTTHSVQISTAEQLTWWAKTGNGIDGHLAADINLSGHRWQPTELSNRNFNGHGHVLSNVFIQETNQLGGFFSSCETGFVIEDLGIINAYIKSSLGCGGLCGSLNGIMRNCFVRNTIIDGSDDVGGLVGVNSGLIINCYANADVTGNRWTGLLAGSSSGTFRNCYAAGKLRIRIYCYNAGITATLLNGEISHCYSVKTNMGIVGLIVSSTVTDTSTFVKSDYGCTFLSPVVFDDITETDLLSALNRGIDLYNDSAYCTWVADSGNINGGYPLFGNKHIVQCPNVTDISLQNITMNNNHAVSVSWTDNSDATQWRICYRRHDKPDTTFTCITTTNNPDTIFGLSLGYAYEFNVRAICGIDNLSGGSEAQTFIVDLPFWTDIVTTQPTGYVEDAAGNVEISSAEGLAWFAVKTNGFHNQPHNSFSDKTVTLKSDINIEGYRWYPTGTFSGTFDGLNHRISNIYMNDDDGGLFGAVYQGRVKNVILDGGLIICNGGGGLIETAYDCYEISNCHSSTTVYSKGRMGDDYFSGRAGALCGELSNSPNMCNYKTVVSNCSASGTIYGIYACGDLIGHVWGNVEVRNCYATGDVNAYVGGNSNESDYRGGLIGYFEQGASAFNCFSTGTVEIDICRSYGKVIGCPYLNTHIHYIYGQDNVNEGWNLTGNYCEDYSNFSEFHHDGNTNTLLNSVSIAGTNYSDLLDALNAWVISQNDSTLRLWTLDSISGYPVFGDYFVPSCYNPTDLIVSQATEIGDATIKTRLTWSQWGIPDHWEVLYVAAGQPISSGNVGTIVPTQNNPCILAGIPVGQPLDFYVRAACGDGDTSGWCGPVTYLPDKLRWTEVVTSQPEGFQQDANGTVYISSAEGLSWLASIVNRLNGNSGYHHIGHIILTSDIDLSAYRWTPIGCNLDCQCSASCNGNNHTVSGLYCNELSDNQGLFGYMRGHVYNLTLTQCDVHGETHVGAIVGYGIGNTIMNCSATGNVLGKECVGGLVGYCDYCDIKNSYFIGNVTALSRGICGGICGLPINNTIVNCYVAGEIAGNHYSGIITGYYFSPTFEVSNCYYKEYETSLPITDNSLAITINNSGFSGSDYTWTLSTPPYISGAFHPDLVDALNAWVNTHNTEGQYFRWVADTNMVNDGYPVFESSSILATLPTVFTYAVSNITPITANCGGNVSVDGGAFVAARGVCWSTSENPTIAGAHTNDGTGTGSFSSAITGLTPNTTYYVRAYATNSEGTVYGEEVTFTTAAASTTFSCGDYLIDGNLCYTTMNYGSQCWMTQNLRNESGSERFSWEAAKLACPNGWHLPTQGEWDTLASYVDNNSTQDSNIPLFFETAGREFWMNRTMLWIDNITLAIPCNISGQTINTNYGIAYLSDDEGTGVLTRCLRDENSFAVLPTVTTATVNDATRNSATCGGHVTADGGATVTARGVCWSTSESPTVDDSHTTNGSGAGAFTSQLTNLDPVTTYYVRAYATNSKGTAYGETVSFTTPLCNPLAVNILSTNTSVLLGENVTLSASGAENYSWSTGETSSSITVFPTTTTTYSVTGSDQFGCEDIDSITINVSIAPETPVVTVDHDTVCVGAVVTLSVTNPIANISYIWYVNGMEIAGVSQANMTVFPDQSGSNTYSVMAVDNQGYTSALASVSVFVRPTPTVQITGNQHVCETEPVTMTANVGTDGMISDNLHYVWFVDGQMHDNMAYNLGDTNLFVEYLFPRSEPYHLSVQVTFGDDVSCASQSEEYLVYVHTQPNVYVVATETSICVGGSTTIMAVVNDFYDESISYNWSDGNSSPIYTFSPSSYGPYTLTVTVTSGLSGCSSEDEITIQVNEIPEAPVVTADNVLIFDGNQVTLSVTNPIADAVYTWYRNGFLIPEASQPSLIESLYTFDDEPAIYNYTVVATLYNSGCVSESSDNTEVTVFPTSVANLTVNGNTTFCEGSSTTLHVDVTPQNGPTYSYQWYKDDVPIPGATSADYVVAEPARTTSYNFYVVVSANGSHNVTAYAPAITVVAQPVVIASISESTICAGGTATLTALVSGGVAGINGLNNYSYQWFRNADSTAELVSTDYTYTTAGDEPAGTYAYWVAISNGYGCNSQSESVTFTVADVPTVTITPAAGYNETVCDGGSTVLQANTTGGFGEISYQWYKNGLLLFGENNQALALNNLYLGENYSYTVSVTQTGVGCAAISAPHVVNVNAPVYTTLYETACDDYTWNGITYTATGDYSQTFTNANGCDSVVTLHLTVNYSNSGDTTAVADDRFDWYEHTYLTMSGDYTHVFTNQNGCDSVVTLHLTVNNPTISVQDTVLMPGYFVWHGMVFTSDTVLFEMIPVLGGYDSLVIYHVFVTPTPLTVLNVDTCVSYTLNGQTYTETGDYVQTFPVSGGMDSVVVLYLTIFPADSADFAETACGSYEWNGQTYTASGDYTQTLTNANGCDSVVTLHLTVFPADSADFAETACESFTWEGTTYTSSGDYTKTFTNVNGCDSVVTLHLTVNNSAATDEYLTICENELPYHYLNGQIDTIFEVGTPELLSLNYNLLTETGCDSVVTLHLTVFPADSADFAETACESFTWEGTTYTTSGDYTQTFTNVNGCDSVVTLHLIIFPADSADFAETACESFTWEGTTYTTSGDYTKTFTNANGCDSVVTLHLTINQAVSSEFAVETADSCYSWNGHLYCESGDYTQTLTAANGCDSVVTLHLTITVGIDDHNGFAFNVYPNPTNGIVNVQWTMYNGQVGAMAFHVFDAYGKLVDIVAADTHGSSEQTTQIDLSGFANGVYFVKAVADGNVVAVRKVVKR